MNPFEMQAYEPLSEYHDLTGYASTVNSYDTSRIRFPVKKLHIAEEYYERLPWPVNSLAYGMLLPRGLNFRMSGLEKELADKDILHAAETYTGYSLQAARVRNADRSKKLVLTIWENVPFLSVRNFKGRWSNEKVVRYVRDSTDLFIAVTERARKALQIEGVDDSRINVIPAGIDTDRFKPGKPSAELAGKLGIAEDDFTVLFTGRLTGEKGIYDLLHAARLVSLDPELRHVKFVIAGSGPERDGMIRKARALGIENMVKLSGSFSYEEMPALYNAVDAFILPSVPVHWWQEQFGMVLVEAMASGLPVISTLSGSIPEVVGDAGMLIQPGDPVSIYESVRRLTLDSGYRTKLGAAGRDRAMEKFGIRVVAARLNSAYSELK
jgi:glycosyltransferase involved in cell wall biosynthesis